MKKEKSINTKTNIPFGGVYIFAKNIKNEGQILSKGETAVTHIQTDKYSGKGSVSAKSIGRKGNKVPHDSALFIITIIGILIAFVSIPWWPSFFQRIRGNKNVLQSEKPQIVQQLPQSSSSPINNVLGPLRALAPLETGKKIGDLPNGVYFFASPLSIQYEVENSNQDFLEASSKDNYYYFEIQKSENRYYLIGFISDEAHSKIGSITKEPIYTQLFPNSWGVGGKAVAIPFDSVYTIRKRTVDLDETKSVDIFDIGFKQVIENPDLHKEKIL